MMWFLGTLIDKHLKFFKKNPTHGGLPEVTVNVYTSVVGVPYKNLKVYTPIGSLSRDSV